MSSIALSQNSQAAGARAGATGAVQKAGGATRTISAGFGPNTNAPSIILPLQFVLTGLLALGIGLALVIMRPDILATYHYNQYVIATTHVFVLGFISTIVMGALYQLVPVALETRLFSERLAQVHFWFHLAGVAGMVWMFWKWDMKQVGHFGSVYGIGVVLFGYNIVRTLRRVPKWNVVAGSVVSAIGWLGAAILAGLMIAAGKCSYESAATLAPDTLLGGMIHGLQAAAKFMARFDQFGAMHAHAHLGMLGVYIMLIVGISYKLIPMFTLSDVQSAFRARASILLLNLGLAGSFFTILLRSPWKLLFATLVIAGLVIYAVEMRSILKARKRKTLDWGLKYFLTAISLLAPLSLLALVLSWPGLPLNQFTGQLENLYGLGAILGVVAFAILGMLYKILPFLVWFGTYSKHIGASKVPSLADLYSPQIQAAQYFAYLAALIAAGTGTVLGNGVWIRVGFGLFALAFGLFVVNAAKMLKHLFRPQIQPLGGKTSIPAKA